FYLRFLFKISLQLNLTFSNKPGSGQNNGYLVLAGGSGGRLAQRGAWGSDHHRGGQRQLCMKENQTGCRFQHYRKAAW
uniref:Uncharacterized protein n=1 Tax=Cebus imitator TaxID=2715852 RepID=A0A2K5QIN8_CEBIM